MAGIRDLDELLKDLAPELRPGEYAFCTVAGTCADFASLRPVATFGEMEGLTLVVPVESAAAAGLSFESRFRCITLRVYSSLEAVGLTAAVAARLAEREISANVIAAYHHDHIFVPSDRAEDALAALRELGPGATG